MSFRHAWAFLTRLPGGAHPADERALGMSVPWFPVVGAVIGLMIGMVWLGLNELVSPVTSATNVRSLALAAWIGVGEVRPSMTPERSYPAASSA